MSKRGLQQTAYDSPSKSSAFVSPKKAKQEGHQIDAAIKMFVHQASIPLMQRGYNKQSLEERMVYRVSVPNETRATFLSLGKSQLQVARGILTTNQWFDVDGVTPHEYGSTIVYCCTVEKKLTIQPSDQKEWNIPPIAWQYWAQSEIMTARDETFVCFLGGVVQQERTGAAGPLGLSISRSPSVSQAKTPKQCPVWWPLALFPL